MAKHNRKRLSPKAKNLIKDYFLVTLGCLFLAFGDGVFIAPSNIVGGGVSSISIIVSTLLAPVSSLNPETIKTISTVVTMTVLLIVGLIFLGKDFGFKTIYASCLYPAFFALFTQFNVGEAMGLGEAYKAVARCQTQDAGIAILMAIFGGSIVGVGVAIAFLGNGSTGGLDILAKILAKYTRIKEDVSVFVLDFILIVVGMGVRSKNMPLSQNMIASLVGIIGAFTCSYAIQSVYIRLSSHLVCDVISENYEQIQEYVHVKMDHGSTLIKIKGGYSGEDKTMLRIVINHNEENDLRDTIAEIDPNAFVTIYNAKTINGEGFTPLKKNKKKKQLFNNKQ